jgi:excisionase family DNA binding protein
MSIKNVVLTNSFFLGKNSVMKLIGTKEASERLAVSQQRVQALIKNGQLPAEKVGRDWLIKESDLKLVQDRPPGRPSKVKNETA